MVVSYLNFVFFIELKAKTKYRILNFVFQFINKKNEMALWVLEFLIYSVFIILINKQSQWQPAVYLISRFSFLFIYVWLCRQFICDCVYICVCVWKTRSTSSTGLTTCDIFSELRHLIFVTFSWSLPLSLCCKINWA